MTAKTDPLWKHQQQTVQKGMTIPHFLDLSDPGTGKTRSHLEIFAKRFQQGKSSKLLVLAPKTIIEVAWKDEVKKFFPQFSVAVAYAHNRAKMFAYDVDIYITNAEAVNWLVKQSAAWLRKTFGETPTLIIDELTAFKNKSAARSKAIRKVARFFKYRSGLTGTPRPNSITELWHQTLIIDGGQLLGTNFQGFRMATQTPVIDRGFTKWVDKPGVNQTISHILAPISIRHRFEDVMNILPNTTRHITFDLDPDCAEAYRKLAKSSYLELKDKDVTALNAATLQQKLLQVASGAVYTDAGEYEILGTSRYELVTDLVNERLHSVVFFLWKHQKVLLAEYAKKKGIAFEIIDGDTKASRRADIVRDYQAGNLQTIYMHPQTGAHGLTLVRGTAVIWASPTFKADLLKQGLHRIYRGGQTQKTETLNITARNTVDEYAFRQGQAKYNSLVDFLDFLGQSIS